MVKHDIYKKVYDETGVRKEDVKRICNSFLKHLAEATATEDKIQIDGLGVFHCSTRPQRTRQGFGKTHQVAPSRYVKFTLAKNLRSVE